jgi:hypothetical protein
MVETTEAPVKPSHVAARALLYGGGGWAIENLCFGPRYSALWQGEKIPILPIYAIGGAAAALLAPKLKEAKAPWPVRGLAYAALLSSVEYLGCQFDRHVLKACSWDYTDHMCEDPAKGCVDLRRALLWGALGLAGEAIK